MIPRKTFLVVLLLMYRIEDITGEAQGTHLGAHHTNLMPFKIPTSFPSKTRSMIQSPGSATSGYDHGTLSCYMEGLYTHPYDCVKFYRCLDVFGNGELISMQFTCKEGNIFSAEHKACVPGTCSSGVISAIAMAMNQNATLDLNTMHLNTTVNSTLPNNEGPECLSEGRLADPDDCGQYFECIRSSNGDLIAYGQSCNGMAFDATLSTCVPIEMVKECIAGTTLELRGTKFDEQKLKKLCEENNNRFVCLDCKTLLMCAETQPHVMPCKYGSVCQSDRNGFVGGICYPDEGSECACNADDTFKPDIYDPSKFLSCRSTGADPVVKSCPDDLKYNKEYKSCGLPMDITCSVSGTFALESDCTIYQSCLYTTTGWIQNVYKCEDKTMFNEITGKCEDPCGWYDGTFECNSEGRFSNPGDCTRFFECIADFKDSGKFIKLEHECPEGYAWLPTVDRRHCVPRGSTAEKCHPQKPNTCRIPSGWCKSKQVPAGFERLENGRVIRRTSSSDPRGNYDEAMSFCKKYQATPFIPKSSQDYQLYLDVRSSQLNEAYMWFPGDDKLQENRLIWYGGDDILDTSLFPWCRGDSQNTNSYDCLYHGGCNGMQIHFEDCNRNDGYPPICEVI